MAKITLKTAHQVANVGVGVFRTPTCTGAPAGTRTRNLLIRSQALYPIELRGQVFFYSFYVFSVFLTVLVGRFYSFIG